MGPLVTIVSYCGHYLSRTTYMIAETFQYPKDINFLSHFFEGYSVVLILLIFFSPTALHDYQITCKSLQTKNSILWFISFLNQYSHFKSAISSWEYFAASFVSLYCLLCSSPALLEIMVSWWCLLISKCITQFLKKRGWSFGFFLTVFDIYILKINFCIYYLSDRWSLRA